jgi:hypothetical protein
MSSLLLTYSCMNRQALHGALQLHLSEAPCVQQLRKTCMIALNYFHVLDPPLHVYTRVHVSTHGMERLQAMFAQQAR